MISISENRIEKLLKTPLRYFYHSDFDNPESKSEIIAEMPDIDIYNKNKIKVNKIKSGKINPEMIPCYESPLLSFAQEQHLFRKMSYYKYRAKNIIATLNHENPNESKIQSAESYIEMARDVRNQISSANFRLATQIMKHRHVWKKEQVQTDVVLSDAYFDVIKAVDYFNWTLGHRFSTYATWVVKKNFFRDYKQKSIQSERFSTIEDTNIDFVDVRSSGFEDERDHGSRQKIIKSLVGMLVRENLGTDRVRQAYILENYYGVNGREKKTLEEISGEIGVTKERVRQLKEKGLEWIKERVLQMSLEYNNDCPNETVF